MKTVNPQFIADLLGPLGGGADDDEETEKYLPVDPNDEAAMRAIIREELVPEYPRLRPEFQRQAKLALAWALSFNRPRLRRSFNSMLLPFDHPDDPALFFEWLWDELFPGEDYHLSNPDEYLLDDDFEGPTKLGLKLAEEERKSR
jgi:hypothetical protein